MKPKLFTRNFTLLILGQALSLFGNFILRLSLSMYVLDITGSAAVFAGILSASTVPTILCSPLGGILADRADRRKLMVLLDAATGVSVLCAALLLSERGCLVVITILMILLSVLGAFETPVVQACIPSMLSGDYITKGNAVVNQAASLSYLIAPTLGGIWYSIFGLKPVMAASTICFFATALLECFIRLNQRRPSDSAGGFSGIRQDLADSVQYMRREQPFIWKMLLLIALSRFFVMGIAVVGLPYIIRTVLKLDARYFGAAESASAVAAILGSIAAGLLTGKLRTRSLSRLLSALGVWMLPAGLAFLLPVSAAVKYGIVTVSFGGMEATAGIFSIFAVSLIQQKTPKHLIGKIMAYTSTVTLCVQPLGQIFYGFLFDCFHDAVFAVLLTTGSIVCAIGALSCGLFQKIDLFGN